MGSPFSLLGGDIDWHTPSPDGDETEDVHGLMLILETRRAGLMVTLTRTFPESTSPYMVTLAAGSDDEPALSTVGPFGAPDELFGPTPSAPLRLTYPHGIDGLRIAAVSVISSEQLDISPPVSRS
jgi:hypothetical protein